MKFKLLILFFCIWVQTYGQRFSLGGSIGSTVFFQTRLSDNYIISKTSYNIFITGNEKKDFRPVFNQYINGLSTGFSFNVDYKSWMITSEINFAYNRIRIPIYYPGNSFLNTWGEISTIKSQIRLPILVSYKLSKKANGFFIQGGMQFNFNSYNEQDYPESELPDVVWLFSSGYELYGVVYSQIWNEWNAVAALGHKKNDRYISLRATKRILGNISDYPDARFFQIDFIYSKTLNFQKLRKGHIIYTE